MAEVTLTIGDRAHVVACRDGEEAQFRHLGTLLDERWEVASRASGNMGNERTMLFVALMLAAALDEARRQPPGDSGVADASPYRHRKRVVKGKIVSDRVDLGGRRI